MYDKEYIKMLTEHRHAMLANGYSPIPNRDKACFMKGWSNLKIDDDAIKRWSRMHKCTATGLRVENGLCVIDVDIDHGVADDVANAMLSAIPGDQRPERLERLGKGKKFAWYVRTDDLFSRIHTRRWVAPGETKDDATHCVEIFGGGSPRQFGSDGVHSFDETGKVAVMYRWVEEAPWDVPLNALSVISKDQLFAMLDAAEAVLKLQGFTPVPRTKRGESTARREYDLTEDMLFDLLDGRTVLLNELGTMVKTGYTGRCSASWLEGTTAKNRERCLVTSSRTGHVVVWETSQGISHMPIAIKPTDFKAQVDRVAEKLREKSDANRSQMVDGDDHVSAAAKLLISHAFIPTARAPVVPLWSLTDDEAMTLASFKTTMMPYCGVEVGPRGGEKKINPVDVWLSNPNRIKVQGLRMRPDRERPTFTEHGREWLNTYRPPNLGAAEGGIIDGGLAFMEQLVPDARERNWFLQWLAFKWKNPHIPGPAIIMVARDMGTGRGTFGALLKLMFGDRYVVNVPFKIFAGLNYQSQYTDWGLDALFAIVNESSAGSGTNRSQYQTKHDVYEHLKEVVEPRPIERTFIRKSEGSVRAISSSSYLIMTNNPDCIPLPEDDRRFAVLTNGRKRNPEFWRYINDWMEKPSNLAAFAQWLEAVDLSNYDPFAPPIRTDAKSRMVQDNKTELDIMIDEVMLNFEGYFVIEQALTRCREIKMRDRLALPDQWEKWAKKAISSRCDRVLFPNSQRALEIQIKGNTYRHILFAGRDEPEHSSTRIRSEILKNGVIFPANVTKLVHRVKHIKKRSPDS